MSNSMDKKPKLSSELMQGADTQLAAALKQLDANLGKAVVMQDHAGGEVATRVNMSGGSPVLEVRRGNAWVPVAGGGSGSSGAVSVTRYARSSASAVSIVAKSPLAYDSASGVLSLPDELAGHPQRTDNPHAVTAEQVGADAEGAAAAVQSNVDAHTARTDNPHSVTAAQAGAEPTLGNPSEDGMVLSSTAAGARSWVQLAGGQVFPAYKRQYLPANSGADDPTDFASAVGMGNVFTTKGEICHSLAFNGWGGSFMFSINVSVATDATVNVPLFWHDDSAYMYVDGSLVPFNTNLFAWAATAGEHVVQFIVNNTGSNSEVLLLGEWIDGSNVTFVSTP